MKTKKTKVKSERKYLYKLIGHFAEKDLHAVRKFAEFIKRNNGDDELMQILHNAPYDEYELNQRTIAGIKKSREEFLRRKTHSLTSVKKKLGI